MYYTYFIHIPTHSSAQKVFIKVLFEDKKQPFGLFYLDLGDSA